MVCMSDENEQNKDFISGQGLCGNRGIVCPDVLCEEAIYRNLNTGWYGSRVVVMEETDSTNEVLKRSWCDLPHGTVVIARSQSLGRGRLGRSWESNADNGIWMSFLIKSHISPGNIASLTLVAAMACNDAIRSLTGLDTYIKWPNDIVINGRKLAGILTEASFDSENVNYVIVGIGINVSMSDFNGELAARATSFAIEGVDDIDRNALVARIGECFEKYYEIYMHNENMSELRQEYEQKLVNINREVVIIEDGQQFGGIACGINDMGELLIQKRDGNIVNIRSGEVSVRGIYGYV